MLSSYNDIKEGAKTNGLSSFSMIKKYLKLKN